MEHWWVFVILFFLFLMLLPQIFKLYFTYNPKNNNGMVVIKIFFIKISYFTFELKHTGIIIRTKKERKQVEYKFSDPKLKTIEKIMLAIKKRIEVRYFDLYSNIGTGDASSSAMLSGVMTIFYKYIYAYIKNLKPKGVVNITSNTDFNNNIFIISLFCKISISIYSIIASILIGLFSKKRNA